MPKIEINADTMLELHDGCPGRNAYLEVKTADELLEHYTAVIVSQKGDDGKRHRIVVFKKIPIIKGSAIEPTY